jgi:hypothetical protein
VHNFTTTQLQAALLALYVRQDDDAAQAYRMTFDELHARMGDESFDAWCEAQGL